jgi:tetratricopeptide (TPR) repeat protein
MVALPIPMTAEDVRLRRIIFILICALPILIGALVVGWYSHHKKALEAVVYDSAVKLAKAGEYKHAVGELDRALTLNPTDLRIYQLRATARHNLGDEHNAILDATQVIDRSRVPVLEAYQVRALAYWNLHDYRHAVEDLDQALQLKASLAAGYTLRGNAYWQMGDTHAALEDFTLSIYLEASFDAYYQRGSVRQILGDYKGAMDDYTNAANLQPNMLYPYRARANLRRRFGDLAGAEADENKVRAIQKSPGPEDPANRTNAPSPYKLH